MEMDKEMEMEEMEDYTPLRYTPVTRRRFLRPSPLRTRLPKPNPPIGSQSLRGRFRVPVGLICDSCHTVVPKRTKLSFHRADEPNSSAVFRLRLYTNCTKCSNEMMVQYPKNSTDFVLSGATKYSEIIDEEARKRNSKQETGNVMELPPGKMLGFKRKMSTPANSDDVESSKVPKC